MPYLFVIGLFLAFQVNAQDSNNSFLNLNGDDDWLLGIGLRSADIPYADIQTSEGLIRQESSKVQDIVPLLFYEGDYLYFEGTEAGIKVWDKQSHLFALHTEYRFFDFAPDLQNRRPDSGIDYGLRWQYKFSDNKAFLASVMTNSSNLPYSKIEYRQQEKLGNLVAIPYIQATIKSADFNDYFYGLSFIEQAQNQTKAHSDIDWRVGSAFHYPLWQELSIIGDIAVNRLGKHTRDLPSINSDYELQTYLGISFSGKNINRADFTSPGYLRLAHAWGTPSNLDTIIRGNAVSDYNNNQLTSIFYGHQLSETLLTLPIEIYATPGLAYHYPSDGQGRFLEWVFAIKGYYTIPIPWRTRLGFAEGLSYTTQISDLEYREIVEKKGYSQASKLLNYLDLTLDINIGDIFAKKEAKNLWLGYGIHHRSAIFESSSLFGRIKGGSNYQSIYLQWHW